MMIEYFKIIRKPTRNHWEDPDPFLREIWEAGYDAVIRDCRCYSLIRRADNYIKEIQDVFYWNFNLVSGFMIDGTRLTWIKEKDGSASRFRELIKPDFVNKTVEVNQPIFCNECSFLEVSTNLINNKSSAHGKSKGYSLPGSNQAFF